MPTRHPEAGPRDLVTACREAGLKATPQRLAVFQALRMADDHPTPEAVFKRVRGRLPSVSLATVYKALASLERTGLISRLTGVSDSKRYDGNTTRHHHLICTGCGRIEDHEDERLAPRVGRRIGSFSPSEVRLQILGRCGRCAALPAGTIKPRRKEGHE